MCLSPFSVPTFCGVMMKWNWKWDHRKHKFNLGFFKNYLGTHCRWVAFSSSHETQTYLTHWLLYFVNVDDPCSIGIWQKHMYVNPLLGASHRLIQGKIADDCLDFKLTLFTWLYSGRQLPEALEKWKGDKSVMTKEVILVKTNEEANWSHLSSCQVHYYTMALLLLKWSKCPCE